MENSFDNLHTPQQSDAQFYADLGLHTHWLGAAKLDSKASGKRPLGTKWQERAYNPAPSAPWELRANLGMRTGLVANAPFSLVAVDLDSPEALAWALEHLPETCAKTRTAHGEHWFYTYPSNVAKIPNKCRIRAAHGTRLDVDIRADGGNIVLAPSVHYSGFVYERLGTWNLAELPIFSQAWFAQPRGADAHESRQTLEPALEPISSEPPTERPGIHEELFEQRLYEHCSRGVGGAEAIAALRAMGAGTPYAAAGERNATLFQAIRLLAEWFPDATDAQLLTFATPSVLATGDRGEQAELENLRDLLSRSRAKYAERDQIYVALVQANVTPTTALIEHGADLRQRLIVTFPNGSHVTLRADGSYTNAPVLSSVLGNHLHDLLGWAERAGLAQFTYQSDRGVRDVKLDTILKRHSTLADEWRGSFSVPHSTLEGNTFVEAIAKRRTDLVPVYSEPIDAWLRVLGGANADSLLDWLATFLILTEPTSALFLIGASGAGKNMLVEGLARFWVSGRPTPFGNSMQQFNEGLATCPVLFADEKLPSDTRATGPLDEHIRQLVTSRSQVLNRKFRPIVTVDGCMRIIVASNNTRFQLACENEESKKALAERVLHIEVPIEAAHLIASYTAEERASWVRGDVLAKHVLWLRDNRVQGEHRARLLVPGNGESLINKTSNRTGTNADVCTWLCGYLQGPERLRGPAKSLVRVERGGLSVAVGALTDPAVWALYVTHGRGEPPSPSAIGRALSALSNARKTSIKVDGRNHIFHEVDTHALLEWADETTMGDRDRMLETLKG